MKMINLNDIKRQMCLTRRNENFSSCKWSYRLKWMNVQMSEKIDFE
jgi:hypothetical protein